MTAQHNLPLSQALGWAEDEVMALLQQEPGLALHLMTSPRQRLHFLAFVLAVLPKPVPASLLRDAVLLPMREVLPRLALNETRGLRRILGRIHGPVIDSESYSRIAALVCEPNTANVLAHTTEVTPALLANLNVLPIAMRTHVIVDAIAHLPNAAENVLRWIDLVATRTSKWSSLTIQDMLGSCQSQGDLKSCLTRLLDALPALEAPPKVIGQAVRVDPPSLIRQLGKQFSNCLDGFVDAEIDGSNHIYHWRQGHNEAVCEVTRFGNLGWFLASCLGQENASLEDGVAAEIASAFKAVGIHSLKVVETYDDFFYAIGHRRNGSVNDPGEYSARNRRHAP